MKNRLYLKDKIIDNIISKLHCNFESKLHVYECVKSQVDINLINSINDRFVHAGDSNSEHVHKFVNRIIYIELNETFNNQRTI